MTDLIFRTSPAFPAGFASTLPADVDSSIPEVWATNVLRKHYASGFWGRFVGGEGSGAPIIQKTELLNKPGDLIHVQVTDVLTGAGQKGDARVLTGNEEKLTTSEIKLSTDLYAHAVRVHRRANKKSILQLSTEAETRLAEWGAKKMDDLRFKLFLGDATVLAAEYASLAAEPYAPTVRVVNGGTTVDDVSAADTLTVDSIQQARLAMSNALAEPIMVDGFPVYIMVTHPNALYKLKREQEYRDWVKDAEVRGKDNPFFRGATVMIDGVVIFDHIHVPRVTNATSVKVSKSLMFGKEAFVEALDENVHSATDRKSVV